MFSTLILPWAKHWLITTTFLQIDVFWETKRHYYLGTLILKREAGIIYNLKTQHLPNLKDKETKQKTLVLLLLLF